VLLHTLADSFYGACFQVEKGDEAAEEKTV
jgi:hypothetical protein